MDTYKSGPFVFSLNYDRQGLSNQLTKAKILFRTIADIPILPERASRLEEELIRKSIFGTAAIEGSPLSQEAVNEILSQEKTEGRIKDAQKKIRNLKEAYKIMKNIEVLFKPWPLEEKLIKGMHEIITKDCEGPENIPGQYRNEIVKVGDQEHGGLYVPPKIFEDIKNLMREFINWINSPEVLGEDTAIRAALAHYHIALIHPFRNGNGRTARAIEAILLKSSGIKFVPHMLSNFYYKNLDDYFWAFSRAEQNDSYDITSFLQFFLEGLISSLEEIQSTIFSWIRMFTLKDYYTYLRKEKEITQRQFDLLILVIETAEYFSLKDLFEKEKFRIIYRKVGERTARRDLKLLEQKRLIKADKKGNFILNYKVLE